MSATVCTVKKGLVKPGLKAVAVGALIALMSGCASDPAPNYFNGGYYMAGDASCARMTAFGPSRILCRDSSGSVTGYRDAMTPQQIQMWQYNQAQQSYQMQQLNQSMQQTNQSIQQSTPQYQPYTAPAVTPITQPGGNQVRCISTDIYTNCRY